LALVEIFLELQRIVGRKVPASKVQPKDMGMVRLAFAMTEEFGKPVKSGVKNTVKNLRMRR